MQRPLYIYSTVLIQNAVIFVADAQYTMQAWNIKIIMRLDWPDTPLAVRKYRPSAERVGWLHPKGDGEVFQLREWLLQ